ncbi:hypothetical protein TNCV_4843931 [Trichonephila clavipes]|uniref:Uncharacterized protein n=1 Tax=Trichonephila clavipes TaxID=2585209 RepID=A0A8X6WL38_TRICX|nr:hypothetical protein TNCV_4843931 [Trichonephila clavipes]
MDAADFLHHETPPTWAGVECEYIVPIPDSSFVLPVGNAGTMSHIAIMRCKNGLLSFRYQIKCSEQFHATCELGYKYSTARAMKVARFNETFPQAELRRLEQAERDAAHRAAETPEQSQARRLQAECKRA